MSRYYVAWSSGVVGAWDAVDDGLAMADAILRDRPTVAEVQVCSYSDGGRFGIIWLEVARDGVKVGLRAIPYLTQTLAEAVEMGDGDSAKIWTDAIAGDSAAVRTWAEHFGCVERAGYWYEGEGEGVTR